MRKLLLLTGLCGLVWIMVSCRSSAPRTRSAPVVQPTAVPSVCDPRPICPGSTCIPRITQAQSQAPADACPRFAINQADVDVYAWNLFLALNWPADTLTCKARQSTTILSGQGPVVWETWTDAAEIFVKHGSPAPWCAPGRFSKPRTLGQIHKVSSHLIPTLTDITESFGSGPLVDQNGRFVRFDKRVNEAEYGYIDRFKLWTKNGQQNTSPIKFPAGSVEIKAAWKVLSSAEVASRRFYTTEAYVTNNEQGAPSPGPNPVTLGLVGLHIVSKTQTNRFWATFEQVDNTTSSFFNPRCTTCTVNSQTARFPYSELDPLTKKPRNAPTQVKRVTSLGDIHQDPSVIPLNAYYQSLLSGSVWANYQLISTQWAPPGVGNTSQPTILANTTIETFFQGTSSCMGCHQGAQTVVGTSADDSYLLQSAQQ